MSASWLLILLLILSAAGFILGRSRAMASAGGNPRQLHSLPKYYGLNVLMSTLAPALLLLVVWVLIQPMVAQNRAAALIPDSAYADRGALNLMMSDVRRVADGLDVVVGQGRLTDDETRDLGSGSTDIRALLGEVGVALGSDVAPAVLAAAQRYRAVTSTGRWLMTIAVLGVAVAGFALSYLRTEKDLRARNIVERGMLALLIAAASIAILTTLGIVLSLIFNTLEFFRLYPAWDFFTGLTWSPSFGGGSQLGILPLLWGTLYISVIALAVAVPIGLFAAIYLSEYARPKVRSIVKPLLEVLAGIPTIVYGLFALLTVGPLLVEIFGNGGILGLGWMKGGTAVMTAGLVMGVMLIPFVSSLSDDIINAVPQAMRDGSYGLGATQSET
ncbi:MAG: phosphate ABC transporter permease family protein, partial [Paracoccaceae bacterium]